MANPYQVDLSEDLFDFTKFDPEQVRKRYEFERDKRLSSNHTGKGQEVGSAWFCGYTESSGEPFTNAHVMLAICHTGRQPKVSTFHC